MNTITPPPSTPRPADRTFDSPWLRPGPYATDYRYTDRATKVEYVSRKYAPLLAGARRVLDVGCDRRQLRQRVGNPGGYVGMDFTDEADLVVDLDKENLPFADRAFDTVVCLDVLEHLARCHEVFDELCRVSRDRVLVSLPNPVLALLSNLFEGRGGRLKYYGLPVDAPRDRHRWFFGFEEAAEFLTKRGERNGFAVEQLDAEYVSGLYWMVGKEARDAFDHANVRGGTCWCVLKRR